MRKSSSQEQHHALAHWQTNQFYNPDGRFTQFAPHIPNSDPCRPANLAFTRNPHTTTHSYNPHNYTRFSFNLYTYSHNPSSPYCLFFSTSTPHPNSCPVKILPENFVQVIIIIYHDFLPTPRRGSHVKSGKTHTQSSRYTP